MREGLLALALTDIRTLSLSDLPSSSLTFISPHINLSRVNAKEFYLLLNSIALGDFCFHLYVLLS